MSENLIRASWTETALWQAVEKIHEIEECQLDVSCNAVAKKYDIPSQTLLRRSSSDDLKKKGLGKSECIGDDNEQELVDYLVQLSGVGYGIVRTTGFSV